MPQTRRASRDAALTELQRLHSAILASRAKRGVGPDDGPPRPGVPSAETLAEQALTRRLQADERPAVDADGVDAPRSRRLWWLAIAAAVVVGGAWVAVSVSQRSEVVTEAAPPKGAPPTGLGAPPPSPSAAAAAGAPLGASSSAAPAATPAATPARPVQVTLTMIRPVWLRVTVDGSRALQREATAGETLSFGGDRVVVVRAGDAGGVQATLNGTDRGPLGRRGWPLTVSITPAGIEPLTPTRPEP